jgi:AcrR family transcriptional regulator
VAADVASLEGLEGLSIATLAERVGMSKSGLFAHFGSKQELQLATIELAVEILGDEVIRPALEGPPGLVRFRTLVEGFLQHIERRTFPGGCFFASAAAELDGRPGPLRDRIAAIHGQWLEGLETCLRDAQVAGELDPKADVEQVAFEVHALLSGGNAMAQLENDSSALVRTRRGIVRVLSGCGARPAG